MDELALPTAATGTVARPAPTADREKALAAARDFESVFLADAFKIMFENVPTDPLSGETGADNWRELLVDEYAKDMSRRGGLGLAGPIADELLKIQEAAFP